MTDEKLQRKLNSLVRIANEVRIEATKRYGEGASLFYESSGTFHVLSNDSLGDIIERQSGIEFSSEKTCYMDCGSW